jgi:hypothetical protein
MLNFGKVIIMLKIASVYLLCKDTNVKKVSISASPVINTQKLTKIRQSPLAGLKILFQKQTKFHQQFKKHKIPLPLPIQIPKPKSRKAKNKHKISTLKRAINAGKHRISSL